MIDTITHRTAFATRLCAAFAGTRLIATGPAWAVAISVKRALDGGEQATVLVFDDSTGEPVDLNLQGSLADVEARYAASDELADAGRRGPGRPKLGVVAKEVTLLPRHWAWLASRPGGASVTLRKLVEEARRATAAADLRRHARDAAYRFMTAMAGNEPGYEEAIRALFATDPERFELHTRLWPPDVRAHARRFASAALEVHCDAGEQERRR